MKIKITKRFSNPLLSRLELEAVVEATPTPSKENIASELAKELAIPTERIVIKRIRQEFGKPVCLVSAYAYESEKAKAAIEPKVKKKEKKEEKEEKRSESESSKKEKL